MSDVNRLYQNIYKQICQKEQVPLNKTISQGLKGSELFINQSLLQVADITPLQLLLSICTFDAIQVYSRDPAKVIKKDLKSQVDQQRVLNGVSYALSINLAQQNSNLMHCQINDIHFSLKGYFFAQFSENQIVKYLDKAYSKLRCQKNFLLQIVVQLITNFKQALSEPLQHCVSLVVLDLSNNQLGESSGMIIGKIISEHAKRKDDIRWCDNIRGEEYNENELDSVNGLCEITLHNNLFDDRCVRDLCQFLLYDSWVKSIGLRSNQIGVEGTNYLNEMLDTNESLISLDLRENPGFNLPLSKEIFDKLVRNIKYFKETRMKEQSENNMEEYAEQERDGDKQFINFSLKLISNNMRVQVQHEPIQEVQVEDDGEEGKDEYVNFNEEQIEYENEMEQLRDLCQKYQNDNLKLQYENTKLSMQLKQIQKQYNIEQNSSKNREVSGTQSESDQSVLIPRIELMMNELAKMMDALEQKGTQINRQNGPKKSPQQAFKSKPKKKSHKMQHNYSR